MCTSRPRARRLAQPAVTPFPCRYPPLPEGARAGPPASPSFPLPIPTLAGRSSSWRRSCQQVERCYRDRDWVVIEGESGTGRTKLGQAVAQHVTPERTVRVFRVGGFDTTDDFVAEVEAETDGDDFAIVIANVDALPDEALEPLAAILQARAGPG